MTEQNNINPPLIGVSENIRKIAAIIRNVAHTGLNVVVTGETGVGKEVVARNLYHSSPRFDKPFIKINCAAVPEGLLESELFGFERGAFTGADRKKKGKFELSNKGVLFLDEIGDMPVTLQSKLLHVLQNGEFAPLGSEKEVRVDAWVIAATNQDLETAIKKNNFREDLYYRLNIINIAILPLRKRKEDIPHLIDFYLNKYTSKYNNHRIGRPDVDAMDKLISYPWPGNVRELQNILKNVVISGSWDEVVKSLINRTGREEVRQNLSDQQKADTVMETELYKVRSFDFRSLEDISLKKIKKKAADKVEKEVISYVLNKTFWNRTKAAKLLSISYKTLLYKINELNIEPKITGYNENFNIF